jgi:hypothetical protein
LTDAEYLLRARKSSAQSNIEVNTLQQSWSIGTLPTDKPYEFIGLQDRNPEIATIAVSISPLSAQLVAKFKTRHGF